MLERRVLVNKNSSCKKPALQLTSKLSKAILQVERLENSKGHENNENVVHEEQQQDTENNSCYIDGGQEFELLQEDVEKWDQYVEENMNISKRPDLQKVTQKFEEQLLSQGQDPYNMNPRMLPSLDFSLDHQVQNEEDKYWLLEKNIFFSNSSPQKHIFTPQLSNLSNIQEHELEISKFDQKLDIENSRMCLNSQAMLGNEGEIDFADNQPTNDNNNNTQHYSSQRKIVEIPLRIPCNNQLQVFSNGGSQYQQLGNQFDQNFRTNSDRSNNNDQNLQQLQQSIDINSRENIITRCNQQQKNVVQIPLRIPCNNSQLLIQNQVQNKEQENRSESNNRGNITPRLSMQCQNHLDQNCSHHSNQKQQPQQQIRSSDFITKGTKNQHQNNGSVGCMSIGNIQQQQKQQSKLKRPGTAPCARNQAGGQKQLGRNSLESKGGAQAVRGRPSTPSRYHYIGGNNSSKREACQQRISSGSINSKSEATCKRSTSQTSVTSRQQVSSAVNSNVVIYKQQIDSLNHDLQQANIEIQNLHRSIQEKQQLYDEDQVRWETCLQQERNRSAQLQEQLSLVQERLDKSCQELLLYQNRCLKFELQQKALQDISKSEVDSFQNVIQSSDASSQLDRQLKREESSTFSCELKDLHIAIVEEFQNQKTQDQQHKQVMEDACAQNKENCQLVINTSVVNPMFEESTSPKSPTMEGRCCGWLKRGHEQKRGVKDSIVAHLSGYCYSPSKSI